jgi:hypothetical protein
MHIVHGAAEDLASDLAQVERDHARKMAGLSPEPGRADAPAGSRRQLTPAGECPELKAIRWVGFAPRLAS